MTTETHVTDPRGQPFGEVVVKEISPNVVESRIPDDSVSSYGTIDRYGFISRSRRRLDDGLDDDADDVASFKEEEGRLDVNLIRSRELKWIEMLHSWRLFMNKDYKKVRSRCRKGIPASIRPEAWAHLCGGKFLMQQPDNEGKFQTLYTWTGHNKWDDDIEKDLHRNFPTHELFGGCYEQIGQRELYNVLRAYSVYNPKEGYCQAQAPVAALLLMNMPSEQAFWCLVSICERYVPGYYSPGMQAIQLDAAILLGLLGKVAPAAHRHLVWQGVEPLMFMTEWFLCAFTRTLPWGSVLRIWDMFICEGVKILFRVALVILKHTLTTRVLKNCQTLYDTLTALKNLPEAVTKEDFLVEKVISLNIDESDMKEQHRKQLKLSKKKKRTVVAAAAAQAQPDLSPAGRSTAV